MKSFIGCRMLSVAGRSLVLLSLSGSAGVAFGAEGGGGLTVIPDWTFWVQLANFLFLIWVLNLILYRPIRNVLIQRKEKISGLEENIESSHKDVEEKEDAFNKAIRAARAKGLEMKDNLLAEAADEEKKIISAINEKAQADLVEVRGKIGKDAQAAKEILMQEVDGFATAISEKILGRAV